MKKGFTLIELLAVIVILAIISLIAIPIVLDIIADSRRSAAMASADGYIRAVNYKIAQEALKDNIIEDGDYVIGENAISVDANNSNNIEGEYTVENSSVLWAGLCVNHYSVSYSNGVTAIDDSGNYCNEEIPYVFEEPEAELLSNVCTDDSKYTNETKFKIKTVEDLVCLSNLVNGGKNFVDKEIYLLSDIDFNSDDSYSDPSTTAYGDINGDGVTEGLKIELTTGRGFNPIGNSSNKFSGTFLGYAYTISNLMINRETQYLGLFGYNSGTINGIKLRSASVTSNATTSGDIYIGSIAGINNGTIKNIDAKAIVSMSTTKVVYYAGGIIGKNQKTLYNAMFSGTVSGYANVGGLVGSHTNQDTQGVVYDSSITSSGSGGILTGNGSYSDYIKGYTKNSTVSAETTVNRGANFSILTLEGVDGILDTYIGGDNDEDYYYFDYDNEGNIVLFSTQLAPIQNTLNGSGTEEDPYLINNENDWRVASTLGTKSKYFSVTSDIDFTNKNYYALGTGSNKFNGNINGNMHTISNVSLIGQHDLGLFGYNQGTIEGFEFDNITVSSVGTYVGLIAGINTNTGKIIGIRTRNTTVSTTASSGDTYIGGLIGQNSGTINNVDVKSNVSMSTSSSVYYAGGIIGRNQKTLYNAMFSGTVSGYSNVGGLVGSHTNQNTQGVVYDSSITSSGTGGNLTGTSSYTSYINGYAYNTTISAATSISRGTTLSSLTIDSVASVLDIFDTDSDHYYFASDGNGGIALYNDTEQAPDIISGSGTEADPYLISDTDDWTLINVIPNGKSATYLLTADLDFTNKTFNKISTSSSKFTGHLIGNMHTISNVSVSGTGVFEYNKGTLEGIRFNNISITSTERGTGLIGTNEGTVKGVEVKNLTINATISSGDTSHTGGLVGINKGLIKTVVVEGDITSNKWRVGGIVGYNNAEIDGAVFKGNISTSEAVGGLVGKSDEVVSGKSLRIKGLVYNTTITASVANTNMGKTIGSAVNTTNTTKNIGVTLVGTRQTGYYVDGTEINELTTSNISDVVDTTGSNSDGYYVAINNGNVVLSKIQ